MARWTLYANVGRHAGDAFSGNSEMRLNAASDHVSSCLPSPHSSDVVRGVANGTPEFPEETSRPKCSYFNVFAPYLNGLEYNRPITSHAHWSGDLTLVTVAIETCDTLSDIDW